MAHKINKVQEARNALRAMRQQVGLFQATYQEMTRTLDQAAQCLDNESIAPAEADTVRATILGFHTELQTATMDGASEICNKVNIERCRLMDLYYKRENILRGFTS